MSKPETARRTNDGEAPFHNLTFSGMRSWLRICFRYRRQIAFRKYPFVIGLTTFIFLCTPFRMLERVRFRRRIKQQEIKAPVFIVGHWRSGTTNLHNLMLQDKRFGFVTLLHCVLPHGFLTFKKMAARIAKRYMPSSRPMDQVPTGLDAPMSEDFALAGVSDLSHYVGYYFPQILEETFRRTVLFEGVSEKEKQRWEDDYKYMLKKVAYENGGKTVVLKNPPNAGRIQAILEMFPDARFIIVRRNPYVVYASTCKLMKHFMARFALQKYDLEEVNKAVLHRQALIMKQLLDDIPSIPPENYFEVQHEEVCQHPVENVRNIYEHFQLEGFEDKVLPTLKAYTDSISDYQTNTYHFEPEELARINEELGFLLEAWNYQPPDSAPKPAPAASE